MFSHLCTGEARVVSRHIDLGFIERPHTVLCSPEEEGMSSTTCFFFLNIHIIVLYTHAILKTHNVIIIQKKIREGFFGASFFFSYSFLHSKKTKLETKNDNGGDSSDSIDLGDSSSSSDEDERKTSIAKGASFTKA